MGLGTKKGSTSKFRIVAELKAVPWFRISDTLLDELFFGGRNGFKIEKQTRQLGNWSLGGAELLVPILPEYRMIRY